MEMLSNQLNESEKSKDEFAEKENLVDLSQVELKNLDFKEKIAEEVKTIRALQAQLGQLQCGYLGLLQNIKDFTEKIENVERKAAETLGSIVDIESTWQFKFIQIHSVIYDSVKTSHFPTACELLDEFALIEKSK